MIPACTELETKKNKIDSKQNSLKLFDAISQQLVTGFWSFFKLMKLHLQCFKITKPIGPQELLVCN